MNTTFGIICLTILSLAAMYFADKQNERESGGEKEDKKKKGDKDEK